MKSETLETRLLKDINHKSGDVFLIADFFDLAGYDQVARALRKLVRKGLLLKLGQGLYTRAAASPLDGSPVPVKDLHALAEEALDRLGFKSDPAVLEQVYNVPAGPVIAVKKRVRRKIGFNGTFVTYERGGGLHRFSRTGGTITGRQVEIIETTAGQVAEELARRGIGPEDRVTIMIDPGQYLLLLWRKESRAHVVAAGLTEEDIKLLELAGSTDSLSV